MLRYPVIAIPVGSNRNGVQPANKNMHANKSLKNLYCTAPLFVLGALLGGCNDEDHSKPGLNEVTTAVREQYGTCPQWTIGKVTRLDGAPANVDHMATYLVKYSFIASLKRTDTAELTSEIIQAQIVSNGSGTAVDTCTSAMTALLQNARQSNSSLATRYRVTGYGGFTRTESGWHLLDEVDAVGVLSVEPSPAAVEADADDGATDQQRGIFHRLKLLVRSLFHRDSRPDALAVAGNPSSAIALPSSIEPAVASSVAGQNASNVASAPAPASSNDVSARFAAATASAQIATPSTDTSAAATAVEASSPSLAETHPVAQTATPSSASQSVARPITAPDLEGDWQGTYQCGPYIGSGSVSDPDAWKAQVTMTVHNGQATLVRQSGGGAPLREVLAGNVLPDLSLPLTGTGQNVGADHPWYVDFMGRFGGSAGAATFQASGTLSDWHRDESRACRLTLSR